MKYANCVAVMAGIGCVLAVGGAQPKREASPTSYPPVLEGARVETYKRVGDTALNVWIFSPTGTASNRPAIVFFFGGGWRSGSPKQFEQQARHFAARGMVAITADYRVASRHAVKPAQCVADARSCLRWVRQNAAKLGIDPKRVAAAGGSAGGHLAAATATLPGLDETGENLSVSAVPDALVLFNPALVLAPLEGVDLKGFGTNLDADRMGAEPRLMSPAHYIRKGLPPTIIFHGRADTTVPFATAEAFASRMKEAGNRCELVGFEGQPHGFFNYGRGEDRYYRETLAAADGFLVSLGWIGAAGAAAPSSGALYRFDGTISREVLENYLARSITMEGLLNGRGDLVDNIRMLKGLGAKFIGRSLCLWGGEANLLSNLERTRQQVPQVHAADPEMILQACIFEIVTTQVDQVPVPDWAFAAFGLPTEKRNFRYTDMLYPEGQFKDHWRSGQSVPDVSRAETKLWFYFLGRSFIDVGCEGIHLGQTELMNRNDRNLDHYAQVLALIRSHAGQHARRRLVLLDSHVPSGGLVREGKLLMDFHSFPLRIMEVPDKPQEAILKLGFADGIYGRSKGGLTPSGWTCEHLPYLVEIDNWGVSKQPGQARAGSIWIWGYDEITWFAHQSQPYRSNWLHYAWEWVRQTDTNGYLQMPGSRTLVSPLDRKRWYHANDPSPTVPEGYGDEAAIRSVWAADTKAR